MVKKVFDKTTVGSTPPIKNDSISLIYTSIKEQLASQQDQKRSIESKASTLIAFAGGIFALDMGAWDTIIKFPVVSQIFILIGVGFFIISIIFSSIVAGVRKYRSDPEPEAFAKYYLDKPLEETHLQVISNWVDSWKANNKVLEQKALYLRITFIIQTIAFLLHGIALFVAIL